MMSCRGLFREVTGMGDRFKDQVVVITGGGRGIGRATALEFAEEGATMLLAGRRMDALETAAREVRESGGHAQTVHCDVAKEEDLHALVGKAIAKHGRIDVLVNNAGVVAGGRLDEIGGDDVARMVGVNIWAPIRLTQLVLPHMREAKRGTIVNVSSVAGRMGLPFYATYCASKYAMRGFSESLRRELARENIHVVAVYPGPTATDLIENVEIDGLGMTIATAQQVGRAILRGVQWRQPEVFIGIGESIMSRWNDVLPWTVDFGVDVMRERMRTAVARQRTT
jgi:NAD(P)-dependent dehydrogenase (short-subunit alcohol dehydrogenase family)